MRGGGDDGLGYTQIEYIREWVRGEINIQRMKHKIRTSK